MLVKHRAAALGVDRGGLELRLGLAQLRAEHADPGLCLGQIGLGGEILLRQCLHPRHDPGRILQIRGDRGHRGIGRLDPRAGQLIILFGKHAIEARDDLTVVHRHAFVDEDLDQFSGDLGGNGCLAARHHIAGGRKTARRLVIRCSSFGLWRLGLRGGRDLRCGLLRRILSAKFESGKGGECDDAGDDRRRDWQPAATRSLRLVSAAIDRQRSQQFGLVVGHRSFPSGSSLQLAPAASSLALSVLLTAGLLVSPLTGLLVSPLIRAGLKFGKAGPVGCNPHSALASAGRRPFSTRRVAGNLKLNSDRGNS